MATRTVSNLTPEQRWLLARIADEGSKGYDRDAKPLGEADRIRPCDLLGLRLIGVLPSSQRVSFTEAGASELEKVPSALPPVDPGWVPVYHAVVVGDHPHEEMIGSGTTSQEAAWESALDVALFTSTLKKTALRAKMVEQGYRPVRIDAATHARCYAGDLALVEQRS